jgi:hypothetical protein
MVQHFQMLQYVKKGDLIMYLFKNNSQYTVEEIEFETFIPKFINNVI